MAFRRNAVVGLSSGGPQSYEQHARMNTAKAKKLVFFGGNWKIVAKDYDPRSFIAWTLTQWGQKVFFGDEEEIGSSGSDGDVDFGF